MPRRAGPRCRIGARGAAIHGRHHDRWRAAPNANPGRHRDRWRAVRSDHPSPHGLVGRWQPGGPEAYPWRSRGAAWPVGGRRGHRPRNRSVPTRVPHGAHGHRKWYGARRSAPGWNCGAGWSTRQPGARAVVLPAHQPSTHAGTAPNRHPVLRRGCIEVGGRPRWTHPRNDQVELSACGPSQAGRLLQNRIARSRTGACQHHPGRRALPDRARRKPGHRCHQSRLPGCCPCGRQGLGGRRRGRPLWERLCPDRYRGLPRRSRRHPGRCYRDPARRSRRPGGPSCQRPTRPPGAGQLRGLRPRGPRSNQRVVRTQPSSSPTSLEREARPLRAPESRALKAKQPGSFGNAERPWSKVCPATSYSPTQWPAQYHRR